MAESTRERIMAAALRLFAAQGVAGTSISDIERAVGLAAGTGSFHRHFRSKQQVFEATVEHELARLREIRPERAPASDRESLADRLHADLEFLAQIRPLVHILIRERDTQPTVVARVREILVDQGIAGLVSDHESLGAAPVDPTAAATIRLCATVGYFLTAEFFTSTPPTLNPTHFTHALAQLLLPADSW